MTVITGMPLLMNNMFLKIREPIGGGTQMGQSFKLRNVDYK